MAASESEEQLVARAQSALSHCNWEIGECAALWTKKYAQGRTDSDFGAQIGLSGDQVYQRRRVWETFSDVHGEYPNLKWSHFYAAINWEDSAECLQWASDLGATVAEMKAWRRSQHGEDLAQRGDDEDAPFGLEDDPTFITAETGFVQPVGASNGNGTRLRAGRHGGDRDAVATAVAREAEADDYAPFGKRARGPAGGEDSRATAAVPPLAVLKRMTSTLEKVDAALTPRVIEVFHEAPLELQQRFLSALDDLISKASGLR